MVLMDFMQNVPFLKIDHGQNVVEALFRFSVLEVKASYSDVALFTWNRATYFINLNKTNES